jgi:hypothetical protein
MTPPPFDRQGALAINYSYANLWFRKRVPVSFFRFQAMKNSRCDYDKRIQPRKLRLAPHLVVIAALFPILWQLNLFAENAHSPLPSDAKLFIEKSCTGCHRSPNPPAGLDLTLQSFDLTNAQTFGTWVRIHDAVLAGTMPPGGKNSPKPAERETFLKTIAEPMIAHEHWRAATQGRSMLRRLNRYEYENTVRDLLSAP